MQNKDPLRDYGLGDSTKFVTSIPTVTGIVQEPCPNCGCQSVYKIEVPVNHPMLRGNVGHGIYLGCAACPWASPMMMTATSVMG
jgi:hypothetical protein